MKGHAPLYPAYTTRAPERTLAYYTPKEGIVTEHCARFAMPSSLVGLRDIMWAENLLLYVDNIASFPLLPEIIYDYPHAEVSCTSKGETIGIRIKGEKNTSRWIVDSARWGYSADRDLLCVLRALFVYCGVGCATTPGALGQTIERTGYREHKLRRETRPHTGTLDRIREHGFGGRVDTPGLGKHYERLMELDMKGAYAKEYARPQPTGTAIGICPGNATYTEHNYGLSPSYVTWYGECDVYLRLPLRLSSFPIREPDSSISYPTQPGDYRTWLWREQADDIRQLGGEVRFRGGTGWKEWTENGQHYSAIMECLRREAPTTEIAALIKKATVAGIGRHAMGKYSYLLVPPEYKAKGDIAVGGVENGQAVAYNWYVHGFSDPHNTNMLHWNNYTVMQCARSLFWKAYEYAQRGALVATNYDAIYLSLWRYEELALPEKGSKEDNEASCGTWRQRILYDVDIPAPRSIVATTTEGERYVRRPGVQRDE